MASAGDGEMQAVREAYLAIRNVWLGVEGAFSLPEVQKVDAQWQAASRALSRYDEVQGVEALDAARTGLLAVKEMVDSAARYMENRTESAPVAPQVAAKDSLATIRAALIANGVRVPSPEWFEE